MHITILGNGGAINEGLAYNAFLIEGLVCETPPDIMLSLQRQGVALTSIHTIYLSHLHGDHVFGLPFLILSASFLHRRDRQEIAWTIIGPKGTHQAAINLTGQAFGAQHPCLAWLERYCTFVEIDESSRPTLVAGYETAIYKLNHPVDTFGFSLSRGNQTEFAYIADTRWCETIGIILKGNPLVVLTDLNGQENDPEPVHLSIRDLREKALPITQANTVYYGTHLKAEFDSGIPCIKCAQVGMVISTE